MTGSDDTEVAVIQGCDRFDLQPLGGGDDRRINRSEGEITVLGDEFGDTQPVPGRDGVRCEGAGCKVSQEPNLRFGTKPGLQKIRDFCDHELGNDQRTWMGEQKRQTGFVIPVVLVDVGIQGPRVDEKCYRRAFRRRICSILRAVFR